MNVLFVCEDNSALSIMAESILNSVAPGRFGAYSAGCYPNEWLNAYAVEFLAQHRMPVANSRAKSLELYRRPGAPRMDFIITLCDVAADAHFAGWPGDPFIAHWHVETDDATGDADDVLRDNFWTLMRRIKIFASLPHGKLNRRLLERRALTLRPSYL
ncbi:MAG TPA: arsenate reductase ArsC [Burkholderiales bacterium]